MEEKKKMNENMSKEEKEFLKKFKKLAPLIIKEDIKLLKELAKH